MVYHTDLANNEYNDKDGVIKGIFEYFKNSEEFKNVCPCSEKAIDAVFDHFREIFLCLDDNTVKEIMNLQDELFCTED